MARTVRSQDLLRAGLAGGAVAVLLTACGGGDAGDATADPPTPAAAENQDGAPADAAVADFCSRAAGIDERVDTALADAEGDPSLADAFRQIAVDLRTVEAPAPIAADWTAMAAGLDRMADAFGEVDLTDLDSLEALDVAEGDLTAVSDHVDQYLDDECDL
jgi:hypothetical protein